MRRSFIFLLVFVHFGISGCANKLQKTAMSPLDLGEIRAEGWLKNQLRIQADDLSDHLDEFWPDIKDSDWFSRSCFDKSGEG